MNDIEPEDHIEIEDTRTPGLDSFRASHADMVNRYSDAVTKISEGRDNVHRLKSELRKAEEFVSWQERRQAALARRIKTAREFIRAIEDEEDGIE